MSAYAAERRTARLLENPRHTLIGAQLALLVATANSIALAVLGLAATLTPDGHHFRHAADYWYTGVGIVGLPALLVFLTALRALEAGRDGRLGRAGLLLTSVSLATITGLLVYSVAAATTSGTGPLYPIAALASDIGMLLYCAGAYRARFLPRPIVVAWGAAWIIGGVLGPNWGPPLLVAVYITIWTMLRRTSENRGTLVRPSLNRRL
jgi:hypothetical protein